MIEEDIQDLKDMMDKAYTILNYLTKAMITKPVDHSEHCKSYKRQEVKNFGEYWDNCICESNQINRYLNYPKQIILYDKEIKELKKEHKLKKKEKKVKK